MTQSADDMWDAMRSSTFDLQTKGRPDASLDTLLGALGVYGKARIRQVAALQGWLQSPASKPAPGALTSRVRRFLASG